ncbi:MAG: hypothetical protein ABJN69_05040 [Hellea sp.]
MAKKIRAINIDDLKFEIKAERDFILIVGMYGCEPCKVFEDFAEAALLSVELSSELKYLKLRPSQFRDLQSRSVFESVPVAISFIGGKEHKRFNGLPGAASTADYRTKLLDIIENISCLAS